MISIIKFNFVSSLSINIKFQDVVHNILQKFITLTFGAAFAINLLILIHCYIPENKNIKTITINKFFIKIECYACNILSLFKFCRNYEFQIIINNM